MSTLSCNDELLDPEALHSLKELAHCSLCLTSTAPTYDVQGNALTAEEVASLQWIQCAQCRCAKDTAT